MQDELKEKEWTTDVCLRILRALREDAFTAFHTDVGGQRSSRDRRTEPERARKMLLDPQDVDVGVAGAGAGHAAGLPGHEVAVV